MSIETIATYLLAAMNTFTPQQNHRVNEAPEVTAARYEAFAHDVAFAVSQPYVQPLFTGRGARTRTGLVLVSIVSYESQFRADVMSCEKGGDSNHSWGGFQTQRNKSVTCASTMGSIRVALEMVRESFTVCRSMKQGAWLAEYTDGGKFLTERASKRSGLRMNRAMNYWTEHTFLEEEAE